MILEEQGELILRIRKAVVSAAKSIDLRSSFAQGRRKSDLLLVKLRGRREYAHVIATHLIDIFPEVDVEILRGTQKDNFYTFTLVVTKKLNEQDAIFEERRAKLVRAKETSEKTIVPLGFNDAVFLENLFARNSLEF